jgi:hypothetical protein
MQKAAEGQESNPNGGPKTDLGGGIGTGVVGQLLPTAADPAHLSGPQGPGLLAMPPEPPEEYGPDDDEPEDPPAAN